MTNSSRKAAARKWASARAAAAAALITSTCEMTAIENAPWPDGRTDVAAKRTPSYTTKAARNVPAAIAKMPV